MNDIDLEGIASFLVTLDFKRALVMFPALTLFRELTFRTGIRTVTWYLFEGYPTSRMQEIIDGDKFIVSLAGSVFAQLNRIPNYGCDEGRRRCL